MQQVLVLIVIVAVWQAASGTVINPYYLSNPWRCPRRSRPGSPTAPCGRTCGNADNDLARVRHRRRRGDPARLIVSARPFLDAVLSPFIFAAYSMPKIVLAPALILWLGIGQLPAIAFSAVTAFFLVFFNLYLGLKTVPRIYTDTAALMGASASTRR